MSYNLELIDSRGNRLVRRGVKDDDLKTHEAAMEAEAASKCFYRPFVQYRKKIVPKPLSHYFGGSHAQRAR